MKVYIAYLIMNPSILKEYDKRMIDDFKFITSTLKGLPSKYNDETCSWYYLYAFTDNSELMDSFKSTHDNALFTYIKKDMSKKEYSEFRRDNIVSELKLRETDINDVSLLLTKNEIVLFEDFEMIMNQDLYDNATYEYCDLKEKYVAALDKIFYSLMHKQMSRDPGEYEYYDYNYSFGISPEGFAPLGSKIKCNVVNMYLRYFALILRKG